MINIRQELEPLDAAMSFENGDGTRFSGRLIHFNQHSAVMEFIEPDKVVRTSESLLSCEIVIKGRKLYSGKGVISNLLVNSVSTTCVVSLDGKWCQPGSGERAGKVDHDYDRFLQSWQRAYRIQSDYKLAVSDIKSFLDDLRVWLDTIELGIGELPANDRPAAELEIATKLRPRISSSLAGMFSRLESAADRLEEDEHPAHRNYGQRQLHGSILCAPFIHRTYAKPLGYAGDYEMMNMIVRNGLEGGSLYAKLVNAYLLDQAGPEAVRNRVHYLHGKIADEVSRVVSCSRQARIYCIACGPAWEARNFMSTSPLADHASFEFLDFNQETIEHAQAQMDETKRRFNRSTKVRFVQSSVQSLLAGKSKPLEPGGYDLIYCSGLYDYLNDRIIRRLNNFLYEQLRPRGLLVVGNFSPSTPVRNFIEHFLEWFLIYRDARQLSALAPEQASREDVKVVAEPTGANIFLEARKPQ